MRKTINLLYRTVAILGLILPIIDVWKCGWKVPPSISESYYLGAEAPFVLILGSLGIVFFCNYGFDLKDKWCNRISGLAALGVVCFPCNQYSILHYISAITLFCTFAYMCLFVFTDLRSTSEYTKNKIIRDYIYRISGALIIVGFAICCISKFWGEVWMLIPFGISYLVQSKLFLKG